MKFNKLLLAAASLCFVCMTPACSEDPAPDPETDQTPEEGGDNEPEEPETPETPALTEGVRAEGYYKGDYHGEGSGNYWINFTIEDKNDPEGYRILCLDFNGSLAADSDFPTLGAGDYPMNTGAGHPAGTLNGDGDTYMARHDGEGDFTYSEAQSGAARIELIEGLYRVTCSILLEKEEVCEFEYYGPLTFYNRTLDGNMSNLTEDVEPAFTQGMAIYYGDIYEMGSDAWNVVLAEADYDLEINYGQGDAIQLAFNVTNGASAYIPDGIYTLLDANTAEELPAGTMIAGIYDAAYGGYWGCWFYSTRRRIEARLDSGTVEVSREGEIYTLKLQLKDGAGRKVTSTYTGQLTCFSAAE